MILFNFTRAMSAGITLVKTALHRVLPDLYLTNPHRSDEDTPLIYDGDYPHRLPQAYDEKLDIIAYAFRLSRNIGEEDEEFRRRIVFSIGQNSTREGIKASIERLFEVYGIRVKVKIVNNLDNVFDGTSTSMSTPVRDSKGTLLFGVHIVIEVLPFEGSRPWVDRFGNVVTRQVGLYNEDTGEVVEKLYPPGATWRRTANISTTRTVTAFRMSSFRELVQALAASGITVDKVIFTEAGAGGSRSVDLHEK